MKIINNCSDCPFVIPGLPLGCMFTRTTKPKENTLILGCPLIQFPEGIVLHNYAIKSYMDEYVLNNNTGE